MIYMKLIGVITVMICNMYSIYHYLNWYGDRIQHDIAPKIREKKFSYNLKSNIIQALYALGFLSVGIIIWATAEMIRAWWG